MVGKILKDRYQIEERVGEGGMAVVFRAKDALLNRPVAVKIMRRELVGEPSFVERFKREAEAAAGLSHPHIATVFDFGEQDGDYFLVMEYLPSKNLKELIEERGALPPKVALEVAIELSDALKYAHSNGIIHRDVKPQNVLFTEDRKVKLTDFGIARAISSHTALTGTGQLIGSVHYMSPEQARGLDASERSDIYALGVMLFEMLTGKVPFDAETPVAVALKQVQEQPPPIREIDPSISSSLEYVVAKALRKETTARYQSAQELMLDLIKVKEGRQLASAVPPAAEKAATAVLERRRLQQQTAVGRPVVVPPSPPPPPAARPEPLVSPMTWVVLVLTLLIVAGAAAYVSLSRQGGAQPTPQMVEVPDLVGLDRESAVSELRRRGLQARMSQEESRDAPPDTVIRQSPPAGRQLQEGAEVEIWISGAPSAVQVPNLVGMPLDRAQTLLQGFGLVLGTTASQTSLEMQQGYVLKQDPEAGASVLPGSAVNLVLAEREGGIPPIPTKPGDGGHPAPTPTEPKVSVVPLTTSEGDEATAARDVDVRVEVPSGSEQKHALRVVLEDDEGERTVEQRSLEPGESYHEVFTGQGKATIKVFLDGKEVKATSF